MNFCEFFSFPMRHKSVSLHFLVKDTPGAQWEKQTISAQTPLRRMRAQHQGPLRRYGRLHKNDISRNFELPPSVNTCASSEKSGANLWYAPNSVKAALYENDAVLLEELMSRGADTSMPMRICFYTGGLILFDCTPLDFALVLCTDEVVALLVRNVQLVRAVDDKTVQRIVLWQPRKTSLRRADGRRTALHSAAKRLRWCFSLPHAAPRSWILGSDLVHTATEQFKVCTHAPGTCECAEVLAVVLDEYVFADEHRRWRVRRGPWAGAVFRSCLRLSCEQGSFLH